MGWEDEDFVQKVWWKQLLENISFEDQIGDGRMTLRLF
jgi:hypothetical protein